MIVVPREDQDVADREVRYVCGCDTLLSEPPGTAAAGQTWPAVLAAL